MTGEPKTASRRGTTDPTILWRRMDQVGHESARLSVGESQSVLLGTAVFVHERWPCRLDYRVVCDRAWKTMGAQVTGWVGGKAVDVRITVDEERRWSLNGARVRDVEGCIDLDLNFSPSTNLLPIRRLRLAVGASATVNAAWLRFPGFNLEPLAQAYTRVADATYRYESAGGKFMRELSVSSAGFVTLYPDLWIAEASSE